MYKELILELYKHPKNFGHLDESTHSKRMYNPLCGDDITIDMIVKKGTVTTVMFHGESCAICRASASLLTEYTKGKQLSKLVQLDADFMKDLVGIDISPGRIKCLLLPLEVLKHIS